MIAKLNVLASNKFPYKMIKRDHAFFFVFRVWVGVEQTNHT